jgi:hypothetical protein
MLDAWKRHGLWQQYGEKQTVPFRQTVEEHIASFHGRSSLSRQRMSQEQRRRHSTPSYAPFAQDGFLS